MAIITRTSKGTPLTYAELDGNFTDLDARTSLSWTVVNITPEVRPNDPDGPELTNFYGGLYEYVYFNGQTSSSYANFAVPMDYALGTPLKAAVQWTPGNFSHDGNIRFGFEFSYAWAYGSINAPTNHAFSATQTIYTSASGHGNMTYHQHTHFFETEIPGELVQHNMRFLIRFFRDGADPLDTFAGDIFVTGLGFYYQRNKFGQPNPIPPFV